METASSGVSRPAFRGAPVRILAIAGLAIALIAGGSLLFKRPPQPKPDPTTTFPVGVWPPRVQSFADRMVEVRASPTGQVRLYFMDGKTHQYAALDAPTLEGELISENGDAVPVKLNAVPQKGVTGKGSFLYEGKAPIERVKRTKYGLYGVRLTVPYKDANHSIRWKPEQTTSWVDTRHLANTVETVMPEIPATDVEKKLFLTPGGKYTRADIDANGREIASVRYRGAIPDHSTMPPKGALTCPITKTLANPKFTWIIDGKTYRFCCPPCIAEFVRQAKEKPATIKPPNYYVAR